MCRIAGFVHPEISQAKAAMQVTAMCDLQKHGGPDDEGVVCFTDDNLVLGNRRLSLMDLTQGGHQPMQYEDRYTITYNGELYNFAELKMQLQKAGYQFTNSTDTEVILAAFAKWQELSFAKLNGMFAFALWDNVEKNLFLVRDPAGIKPLYVYRAAQSMAFASETRAFHALNFLKTENPAAAICLLAYGHIPEPVTSISGVEPVPKGCYFKWNTRSHSGGLHSFSHFSYSSSINNRSDAITAVHAAITDAVTRQMIADAPVGIFLSGGIDSAIVAKTAEAVYPKTLNTLSVDFAESAWSEKIYQDEAVKNIRTRHRSFLLDEQTFHNNFSAALAAQDMPSSDGINTWFISKYAAGFGLKAVLSGIGGDELFGGYPSFKRIRTARALQKISALSSRIVLSEKTARTAFLRLEGMQGLYLFLRGVFAPEKIAKLLDADEREVWDVLKNAPRAADVNGLDAGNRASWLEFNLYMQNQLLRDTDVMGMSHGVEIRVPLLDERVIRTAMSIDPDIKFSGSKKQLLTDAFATEIPSLIINRKKMGFSFPFALWLPGSERVNDVAWRGNKAQRKLIRRFREGKEHWSKIMTLLVMDEKLNVN